MNTPLDFEKGISEIERRIDELRQLDKGEDRKSEIETARLQSRLERLLRHAYRRLGPAQKIQVARHPNRPGASQYIQVLLDDFQPFISAKLNDHHHIFGGLGRFRGIAVVVVAHDRRGWSVGAENQTLNGVGGQIRGNVRRLFDLSEAFRLPILTFIDVPGDSDTGFGGNAGADAVLCDLERAAIACFLLNASVPVIATIVGQSGGTGALALVAADRVLMLQNAVAFAVSPEIVAKTLWGDPAQIRAAVEAGKITAEDLLAAGIIDEIVPEPPGGAHRHPETVIAAVGDAIASASALQDRSDMSGIRRLRRRQERFLSFGATDTE